jgi:hypothetical protein
MSKCKLILYTDEFVRAIEENRKRYNPNHPCKYYEHQEHFYMIKEYYCEESEEYEFYIFDLIDNQEVFIGKYKKSFEKVKELELVFAEYDWDR